MKPDRSHNDRIVLAAVGVLAMLILGIIVLSFYEKTIGEEAYVVAGAIVGLVGGYVTAGRSKQGQADVDSVPVYNPETETIEPLVASQTPPEPTDDESKTRNADQES